MPWGNWVEDSNAHTWDGQCGKMPHFCLGGGGVTNDGWNILMHYLYYNNRPKGLGWICELERIKLCTSSLVGISVMKKIWRHSGNFEW